MNQKIDSILRSAPVMPVMVIEHLRDAVPLASALVDAGLPVLEITLRTACAVDAIRAIRQAVPHAIVGAGTVLNEYDIQRCLEAGAEFLVSPGATDELLKAAKQLHANLLPGVATVSEAMRAAELGFEHLKLFPAEAVGGVALLKSISGPLPQLKFCPTGGISVTNAANYLALENVLCVGGSWMASKELVNTQQWDAIAQLARASAALRSK